MQGFKLCASFKAEQRPLFKLRKLSSPSRGSGTPEDSEREHSRCVFVVNASSWSASGSSTVEIFFEQGGLEVRPCVSPLIEPWAVDSACSRPHMATPARPIRVIFPPPGDYQPCEALHKAFTGLACMSFSPIKKTTGDAAYIGADRCAVIQARLGHESF